MVSSKTFNTVRKTFFYARILLSIAIVGCVAYVLICLETVAIPPGYNAMAPFIKGEDRLLVRKSPSASSIQRFNVVIYHPIGREDTYIGRVIGMPGERISSANGVIFINGAKLDEAIYTTLYSPMPQAFPDINIPDGCFFILVDDRSFMQVDSRELGAIPAGNILHRLLVKF